MAPESTIEQQLMIVPVKSVHGQVGVEGEVSSSIGMSQSLDFGYPSSVRTPDVLSYMGNVVVSAANGSSVVPPWAWGCSCPP